MVFFLVLLKNCSFPYEPMSESPSGDVFMFLIFLPGVSTLRLPPGLCGSCQACGRGALSVSTPRVTYEDEGMKGYVGQDSGRLVAPGCM